MRAAACDDAPPGVRCTTPKVRQECVTYTSRRYTPNRLGSRRTGRAIVRGADLEPSHSRSRVCCADTLGFRDAQNDYTTASHVRVRIVARTNAGQLIPVYELRDVRDSTLGEGESSVREGGVASPRRFAREFGVKRHRRRRHASHSTAPARSPHS